MCHSVGKREDKVKYLEGLNEKTFVNMVSDVLYFSLKHKNIKVMDGTGDGKRDILSIDNQGEKCLTQCKFHYDFTKCSGTNETDEVVMGLLKFGYNTGNFATSGTLSPQAKREYEDNYPKYNLDYFDGERIVNYIINNSILSSYWIDNNRIDQSMKTFVFPVLIRDSFDSSNEINDEIIKKFEMKHYKGVYYDIKLGVYSKDFFEPYQELTIKNNYEGWHSNLTCFKVSVNGDVEFYKINDYMQSIIEELQRVKTKLGLEMVSVRFGKIIVEREAKDIKDFGLPFQTATYLLGDEIVTEHEWVVSCDSNFLIPARIGTSQASFFRYYSKTYDNCINISYIGDINLQQRSMYVERNEFEKLVWNNSFFLTGNLEDLESFCRSLDLKPSLELKYGSNEGVFGWIYPTSEIRTILTGDRQIDFENIKDDSFEDFREYIKIESSKKKLSAMSSDIAYHVACINGFLPYRLEVSKCEYRMADIYYYFNAIPSPINLRDRKITSTKVWLLGRLKEFEKTIDDISALIKEIEFEYEINIRFDSSCSGTEENKMLYVLVDALSKTIGNKKMIDYISSFDEKSNELFNEFEKKLLSVIPQSICCTSDYWFKEYGIIFND